jgi:beta-lactamase regulating signal transducer with metallopeptidase domain
MQTATLHLLVAFSRFAAPAFVSGLWQGVALVAMVAVSLRLLPRAGAAVRFTIWSLAFALLVSVPWLHLPAAAAARQAPVSSPGLHAGPAWGLSIAGAWAALMVWRLGQLLVQTRRLRRIWKRATPVANSGDTAEILRAARRNAILCTSPDVDSPSVIGFFSPRLLIPKWMFARLTETEVRQVVLHECEHLRRGDDWMDLFQKVALALFPLNPALLWMDRRLGLERELACDAGVVACASAPYDYAHCLTRLAEHRMVRRRIALSLSAWGKKSELAYRVQTLLRPTRRMSSLHARVSVALFGLGLVAGSVEMSRVPRFVSFAYPASAPLVERADVVGTPRDASPVVPAASLRTHQSRLRLVQASLPISSVPRPIATRPTAWMASSQSSPIGLQALPAGSRPRVVLAAATYRPAKLHTRYARRKSPRPITAMRISFSPSYAAIPFADGWLLIQL